MGIVFQNVLILFIFGLVGYFFGKKKLIDAGESKVLSVILVYMFLPCMVFQTFSKNFTIDYITDKYKLIFISLIILVPLLIMASVISGKLTKNEYEKSIYKYSFVISNFAYMGYPLAQALFGDEVLLNMIIFGLPLTIYTYTFGYCMLTKTKITPKKLIQPVIIAIILGCIAGVFNIVLPEFIVNVVEKSSDCMGPVSMILTGMVVSDFKISELVRDKKVYFLVLMRLIVLPLAIGYLVKITFGMYAVLPAVLVFAMPCGLNTVVFANLVGEDCKVGAASVLISTLMACITIPLCIGVFS